MVVKRNKKSEKEVGENLDKLLRGELHSRIEEPKEKIKKKVAKATKKKIIKPIKPAADWKGADEELKKLVGKGWGEQEQGKESVVVKYHVGKAKVDKMLQGLETIKKKEERDKKRNAENELYFKDKAEKKAIKEEKEAEKEANKEAKELQLAELQENWESCKWELFEEVFNEDQKISMKYLAKRILKDNTHINKRTNKKINGFRTFRDNGDIIRYNKQTGVYEQEADIYIAEIIQEHLGEMAVDYVVKEVTNKIRRSTYLEREVLLEQPKNFKLVGNGLFDFKTKKLLPFNPEYIYLSKIDINYNPKASYKKFLKFLNQVLETEEEVLAMQEWFGNLLLNDSRFQKACLFFGSGANGKSVLLKIIKRFLGNKNVVSIALQYLESNAFALARLFGKSGNIFFDLPKKALGQTSNFKMVVAGDSITAEKKGKDSFEFTPFCKQMFSCNEVPRTPDTTPAFFRRWLPFIFKKTFEEGDPARIENLEEEFYIKEEMEGILLFALEGLYRLLENKRFTEHMSKKEIEEFWIKHSDSILSFIMDMVEVDTQAETTKQDFFDKYEEYCNEKEYVVEDYKVFFKRLKDKIEYEETRPKSEFGQNRQRMIKGIRIKGVVKTISVSC